MGSLTDSSSPFMRPFEVFKSKGIGILLRQALPSIPGTAAPALQAPIPGKSIPSRHVCWCVNLHTQDDAEGHTVQAFMLAHDTWQDVTA